MPFDVESFPPVPYLGDIPFRPFRQEKEKDHGSHAIAPALELP